MVEFGLDLLFDAFECGDFLVDVGCFLLKVVG